MLSNTPSGLKMAAALYATGLVKRAALFGPTPEEKAERLAVPLAGDREREV
jgi:hypothetical protein